MRSTQGSGSKGYFHVIFMRPSKNAYYILLSAICQVTTILILSSKIDSSGSYKSHCLKGKVLCYRSHIPAYATI